MSAISEATLSKAGIAFLALAAACGARTGLSDGETSGIAAPSSDDGELSASSPDAGDARTGDGESPAKDAVNVLPVQRRVLSAGDQHACAVTATGGVKCWGQNMFQQLGAAAPPSLSVRAVEVSGLDTDIVTVAAGAEHTCALTSHGGVKCWGGNAVGQLGDGTKTSSAMPVDVTGLGSGVTAISAGFFHTCALMVGSGLKCWGSNFDGMLGDGTSMDSSRPVDVVGLASGVRAVSAGNVDTCAVTSAGGVKCWGSASYGVLGMAAPSTSPVDLAGLAHGVAQVGVGTWHACAVILTDGVKCWGTLPENASAPQETLPADVTGLRSGVVQLAVGQTSTCTLTASGAVQCWGAGDLGQLGNGNLASSSVPVDVVGLGSGVVAVSVGSDYACAAMAAGSVQCWGLNDYGQLGDGSKDGSIGSSVPIPVIGF